MKLRTSFILGLAIITCAAFLMPDQLFAFSGWLTAFVLSVLFSISERRREQIERSHISVGELLKNGDRASRVTHQGSDHASRIQSRSGH